MIYRVKGISGYVWGVYEFAPVFAGMHQCARGCMGVRGGEWGEFQVWLWVFEDCIVGKMMTSKF